MMWRLPTGGVDSTKTCARACKQAQAVSTELFVLMCLGMCAVRLARPCEGRPALAWPVTCISKRLRL